MSDILEEVEEDPQEDVTSVAIPSDIFYKAIRGLKRILPSRKSDMPVDAEDCVQITVEDNGVLIWGQKNDKRLIFRIQEDEKDCTIVSTGHFSIPVRTLKKPISKIRKKTDGFLLTAENETLEVDAGIASFEEDLSYHGQDRPSGMDNFDKPEGEKIEIHYKKLRSLVEKMEVASDPDAEKREFLKNIVFKSDSEGDVKVCSADGSIVAIGSISEKWDCGEVPIYSENFDPFIKIFDKEGVEMKVSENNLHLVQDGKIYSIKKGEEGEFPFDNLKNKMEKSKEECDKEFKCSSSSIEDGVDFLDSLRHENENIRLIAENSPLKLMSGKTADKQSIYQVGDEEDQFVFPSVQVKRSYFNDVCDESEGTLIGETKDDEDIPLIIEEEDGNVSFFIMKVAYNSPDK
jgi:hypothetical protein